MASSAAGCSSSGPCSALDEAVLRRVRARLNQEGVRLWAEPYWDQAGGQPCQEIQVLADRYANELGLTSSVTLQSLKHLQSHALEKLAAKSKFQETGIASLRVKVSGPGVERGMVLKVEVQLDACGKQLKALVSTQGNIDMDRIKLICSGRVLKEEESLSDQGVQNGSQIMALLLSEDEATARNAEERRRALESTKSDAYLLAGKASAIDEDYSLQVADQSGKSLELPLEEKKALAVALALHEKGRAALKREDHSLALVFLLEADREYSQCQSELLKCVDNYALLHLDVAWCYLCLHSLQELPAASQRLQQCEENLEKSYGHNMERVMVLKGTTGMESALFVRLHLLQAIVAYHQGRLDEAKPLFLRVSSEMASLKVDDAKLAELISLGYTPSEGRQGLRATSGDVPAAVEHIINHRKEREEIRQREAQKAREMRLRKQLGKCANGKDWVDVGLYKAMKGMGFPSGPASMALAQTNNDINAAIHHLQESPELFHAPDPEANKPPSKKKKKEIAEQLLRQVTAMGYTEEMARKALQKHAGDISKAVSDLVADNLTFDDDDSSESDSGEGTSKQQTREQAMKAFQNLVTDLPTSETDHLDLTLEAEEAFLNDYMKLMFP